MRKTFLTLVLISGFLASTEAVACSCAPAPEPMEALERADAVFTGTVVELRWIKQWRRRDDIEGGYVYEGSTVGYTPRLLVRVDVNAAWKGIDSEVVWVETSWAGSACGFDFRIGRDYLVYAREGPEGYYLTGLCSRTAALWPSRPADLKVLPQPRAIGQERVDRIEEALDLSGEVELVEELLPAVAQREADDTLSGLSLSTSDLGPEPESPMALEDLVGVWKKAYEPGLPGVSEIDDGYLILGPDGSFVEVSCWGDDERCAFSRGTFTYAEGSFVLHRTQAWLSDGSDPGYVEGSRTSHLHLQPRSTVVFFDGRERAVATSVLTAEAEPRDLNYGWGLALGGGADHGPAPPARQK